MKIKPVFRYDNTSKLFRLVRFIWKRGLGAGHGAPSNYHGVIKMALSKKPFFYKWEDDDKVITFFCFRITKEKSFGGIPV